LGRQSWFLGGACAPAGTCRAETENSFDATMDQLALKKGTFSIIPGFQGPRKPRLPAKPDRLTVQNGGSIARMRTTRRQCPWAVGASGNNYLGRCWQPMGDYWRTVDPDWARMHARGTKLTSCFDGGSPRGFGVPSWKDEGHISGDWVGGNMLARSSAALYPSWAEAGCARSMRPWRLAHHGPLFRPPGHIPATSNRQRQRLFSPVAERHQGRKKNRPLHFCATGATALRPA